MQAVMYHYVRERDPRLPQLRFLDIANFREQLDFFEANGGIATREEWESFLAGREVPGAGKYVLTFDDAMSCHYRYVFPELLRRGAWGIFYISALPYTEGTLLNVHRVHLLTAVHNGDELLRFARGIVTPEMIPFERREEFRTRTYATQHNCSGVTEFKRLVNYFVAESFRGSLLTRIEEHFGKVMDASSFYVPEAGLREMHDNGMVLGAHTRSHPVMSKLSYAEQRCELREGTNYVESLTGNRCRTYCHPYGGFHAFNADTLALLAELGVDYAFNVESRAIQRSDIEGARYALPRFDCNEFPHGAAS